MTETSELRSILADQVERLFADQVSKASLEQAEAGAWDAGLWQAVEENGLTRVLVPEDGAASAAAGAKRRWCCAPPDATRRRCRWPRPCWPVGC